MLVRVLPRRICLRPRLNSVRQRTQKRFYEKVGAKEAIALQASGKGLFVDLRNNESFKEVAPKNFTNIPHYSVSESLSLLPTTEHIYLLDQVGFYSEKVAEYLESKGYPQVSVIEGGLLHWAFRGGAITAGDEEGQKEIEFYGSLPPQYASAEIIAKDFGIVVDTSNMEMPGLENIFDNEEEKKEALAQSPRKKRDSTAQIQK